MVGVFRDRKFTELGIDPRSAMTCKQYAQEDLLAQCNAKPRWRHGMPWRPSGASVAPITQGRDFSRYAGVADEWAYRSPSSSACSDSGKLAAKTLRSIVKHSRQLTPGVFSATRTLLLSSLIGMA